MNIAALMVDRDWPLRQQTMKALAAALKSSFDVNVSWEIAETAETGVEMLPKDQTRFQLVVTDMLWDDSKPGEKAKGLWVVHQAATTRGVVVVALSAGDTLAHPDLHEEALQMGAHIFKYRQSIAMAPAGWDGLARQIYTKFEDPGGKVPEEHHAAADEVFVVHGRNVDINKSVYRFLEALKLRPLEWRTLETRTITDLKTGGNPNVFQIIEHGFQICSACVVIFTPDEVTELRNLKREDPFDSERGHQPRPNVLLEAGYALAWNRSKTLIVSVGDLRGVSDLGGMHMCRLTDSPQDRNNFARRLEAMLLPVDTTGDDWFTAGSFTL